MDFGMFMEFQKRSGQAEDAAFREGFDLVDAAEAWGLDAAWLAEFHFSPGRSVLSSPIVIASAIATRTVRLRIGMAVYVLPLNNPLRVAEEVATVDQISAGRFELGVGRSGFTNFYRGYGIDYAESTRRFEEAMEVLGLAWSGDVFSYRGEFFQIIDAQICPRPYQKPHPPLRMAATTAETFARVGARGLPLFVGLRGDGTDELRGNLQSYRAAWRAGGHPGRGSVYLRVPVYAAPTDAAARERARKTLVYYFERQSAMVAADAARRRRDSPDAGGTAVDSGMRARTAAALAALSYEDILGTRVAVGSPGALAETFSAWRESLGIDGIVAELNAGGLLSAEQVRESLRLLTHDVMPRLK